MEKATGCGFEGSKGKSDNNAGEEIITFGDDQPPLQQTDIENLSSDEIREIMNTMEKDMQRANTALASAEMDRMLLAVKITDAKCTIKNITSELRILDSKFWLAKKGGR